MRASCFVSALGALATLASATILQNGQVWVTDYPNTRFNGSTAKFKTYLPNSTGLSFKGSWESRYTSWWSAPGLKFGFTGQEVAITFGPYTTDSILIAYRIDGQDWQLTNVTTNATHLLVSPSTPRVNLTPPVNPSTSEMRVTNWAYGVQIASVHVAKGESIIKIPDFGGKIEVIGDSLSAGQYSTLEGLSSYAYCLGTGLGDTEYSVTAYPGICLFDKRCYGNLRGMFYQWFHTSDTSGRAIEIWGDCPEVWDFSKQPAADIMVINLGTNDNNSANNVTTAGYVAQDGLWEGFSPIGNTYEQSTLFSDVGYVPQIYSIYQHFNSKEYLQNPVLYDPVKNETYSSNTPADPFFHYFNTTGILQHNDIGPQYHPTDVGHIKLASHLIQYIKMKFDWPLYATGPEVQHDTLYWNDQSSY